MFSFEGHNPYFSRWFSAILNSLEANINVSRHNPYFSRWFSAIKNVEKVDAIYDLSQSLF